ncbi:MAG: outer membrane protein assembly factor BamD [Siculibacillus sp.]|nr:outer membrane protein assembly factor BamD [Siculibacillus sp.]
MGNANVVDAGRTKTLERGSALARHRRLAGLALAATMAALLAGCASKEDDLGLDRTPADQLYNEGLVLQQAGKRADAVKKFEDVDRLHPYSDWAKKSVLMQAYTQFERGNHTECITAARRFITLYPGSPDAAYAQYLMAESYYKQIPDVSRDQERTGKAMQAYAELVQKYPDSPYADDARKKILTVKDQLAGKEMDVGRFYLRKGQHLAAINRFKVVTTDYQTTRHVEEALARLVEAYYALGVVNEAQTAAAVLGHNFPDSQWYKDSYSLLKTGGYEPNESSGSWISKSFRGFRIM